MKQNNKNNLGWPINMLFMRFGNTKFIQVNFHPGSNANKLYGNYIMGTIANQKEEMDSVIYESQTSGNKKIEGIVLFDAKGQSSLNNEQLTKLKEEGFDCREIYSIEFVGI